MMALWCRALAALCLVAAAAAFKEHEFKVGAITGAGSHPLRGIKREKALPRPVADRCALLACAHPGARRGACLRPRRGLLPRLQPMSGTSQANGARGEVPSTPGRSRRTRQGARGSGLLARLRVGACSGTDGTPPDLGTRAATSRLPRRTAGFGCSQCPRAPYVRLERPSSFPGPTSSRPAGPEEEFAPPRHTDWDCWRSRPTRGRVDVK